MRRPTRLIPGVLAALVVLASGARPASAQIERRPAPVMGFSGADWLEREGREAEQRPAEIMRKMGLKDGAVVADVGCGTGYFARRMARAVAPRGKVYAVDIQPEMLQKTRELAAADGVTNVVTVLGKDDDPLLPEGSLDWILLVDVYHEFQKPKPMLARMKAALKPKGRIALVEYRLEGDSAAHIRREHRMSVAEIREEWEPAGFEMVGKHEFLPTQHFLIFAAR